MKTLQECDFITASKLLNCEIASIKAVAEVESNGGGFNPDGSPKILFEGHKFWEYTKGKYGYSNVSYPTWISKYYNENQHERLAKAVKLDRDAALMSCSWGKFQVLGANWKDLGYPSLQDFINAMYASETEHLMAFVRFVQFNKLDDELRNKGIACKYFGIVSAHNRFLDK